MNRYQVEFTQQVSEVIEISANSEEEAIKIAQGTFVGRETVYGDSDVIAHKLG